jgi:hypothetical protein
LPPVRTATESRMPGTRGMAEPTWTAATHRLCHVIAAVFRPFPYRGLRQGEPTGDRHVAPRIASTCSRRPGAAKAEAGVGTRRVLGAEHRRNQQR